MVLATLHVYIYRVKQVGLKHTQCWNSLEFRYALRILQLNRLLCYRGASEA